jgi:hypothetical protein
MVSFGENGFIKLVNKNSTAEEGGEVAQIIIYTCK